MVTQTEDARIVSSAYGPIQQSWRKRYAEAIADFLALGNPDADRSQLVSLSTGEPHDLRGFAYPALLAALLIPFMGISGLYANLELSLASRVRRMFLVKYSCCWPAFPCWLFGEGEQMSRWYLRFQWPCFCLCR